jgi:hypothetical protein
MKRDGNDGIIGQNILSKSIVLFVLNISIPEKKNYFMGYDGWHNRPKYIESVNLFNL